MDRLKTKTEQLFDEIYAKRMAFWKNIATNIFEWKGLEQISPDLTSEIVEEQFFENGKSFVYDQNEYGKVWLPVDGAGNWNIYHRPTKFNVKGFGFTEQVNKDIGVLVKNNGLGIPTRELIEYDVMQIVECEMVKRLRRNSHKTPFMLSCTKKTELTAKNYFKQIMSDEPAIYRDKGMNNEDFSPEVLNTDVAYLNDKLDDEINNYKANILTILGLDNYVEDKAERVQSAEVESNDEFVISAFRVSLESRKKACEEINKRFGTTITVDYVKGEQIETTEREEDDEQIHNRTQDNNQAGV